MKYMKIQSDLHAKSTLVTCNSLINVVFNNTLANNSNKECLMKVCLEHDPRGCLFICLCTAALMIFLFLPLTASNKKPAFRTFHKLHLFQWCNAGSFPTVEKLKKGELSKKSYELEKKKICVRQMYHPKFAIFFTLPHNSNCPFKHLFHLRFCSCCC